MFQRSSWSAWTYSCWLETIFMWGEYFKSSLILINFTQICIIIVVILQAFIAVKVCSQWAIAFAIVTSLTDGYHFLLWSYSHWTAESSKGNNRESKCNCTLWMDLYLGTGLGPKGANFVLKISITDLWQILPTIAGADSAHENTHWREAIHMCYMWSG